MTVEINPQPTFLTKAISYTMLFIATLVIFWISQSINFYLHEYELNSMYISFCAGFILFIPLASLILHPLIFIEINEEDTSHFKALLKNAGLVTVIQFLFFLIWITDAVAIYSIYVDQNSFLAKAFNITSENQSDLSVEFYWANIFLAWLFSWLSLIIGVMPCLIARVDNKGVVKNFVASFSFAKQFKMKFFLFALFIAFGTVMPLLYIKYLFLFSFPLILIIVLFNLSKTYLVNKV